ncbi:MAG TPA: glycoside hydrolase family 38 C-terminal domain-containing protein [Bacteroidales bacterium]|nr:glycoside hydrolase family 38 C-terminal domain-containing protein [Bacteroidales bacterium]HNS47256.1 glycoside hydrolase family 38 C-terminal domain-containing protein [Bacteroidales bacterium]
MRSLITIFLVLLTELLLCQNYLSGYAKSTKGEELLYHSPQPDADRSLLVRSENSSNYIEWETEPISCSPGQQQLTFIMLAGIDVNLGDVHSWNIHLNDRLFFTIESPPDTVQKNFTWPGPERTTLRFTATQVDKYSDFMGYLFLDVPAHLFPEGRPLRIRVQGESAGSRTWFMVFKYEARNKVSLVAENAITTDHEQVLRVDLVYYGDTQQGVIELNGKRHEQMISFGYNVFCQDVPVVTSATSFHIKVIVGTEVLADQDFQVDPVVPVTIYLLHHSHNDIGYTHVQDEVERMQWKNLEDAIALGRMSADFPEGERFRWNTEVMWAVDSWIAQASPQKQELFWQAVQNGWMDLNALYANTLTGLCSSRELIQLLESAQRIAQQCGVKLRSAMVSDIPGLTWGLVPVLVQSGVNYLSLGNNSGHRVGNLNEVWGDRPFWWVSQSGEDSVLCWIHGKGYSYFHTGLGYEKLKRVLTEEKIHSYIHQLAAEHYPYDMAILRYNIGSDNGPVDPSLIQTVKSWNQRYSTPKLVISTVSEAFKIFERKYGQELPSFKGDLTGYWEDGAYSSAKETALNRQNASRLEQAEVLWMLKDPQSYPEKLFREAWKKVLLYDEHTWGSWNSISEPLSPFTLRQWEIKRSFALRGDTLSRALLVDALPEGVTSKQRAGAMSVYNTTSWQRTDLVTLPPGILPSGAHVKDKNGNMAPVQVLKSGEAVFLAVNVPPLGSKIYYWELDPSRAVLQDESGKDRLENQFFIVDVDPVTGAINRIYDKSLKKELVDRSVLPGLNTYYYVAGRDPSHPQSVELIKFKVKESGPVISSLQVVAQPPGCDYFSGEIRLIHGLYRIEIINRINKTGILAPESIHLAFPFNVPEGIIRYDLGYAVCRAEEDQLPGACRNYITAENWVDVSNQGYGITWVSPDAPIIEIGQISTDATVFGWTKKLQPTQTFYSYLMNNYWETNYKASQDGEFVFRYILLPHEEFDAVQSERRAIEQRQSLIAALCGPDARATCLFPLWDHPAVNLINIRLSADGKGTCLTLFNSSMQPATVDPGLLGTQVFQSDLDGNTFETIREAIRIPGMGWLQVVVF